MLVSFAGAAWGYGNPTIGNPIGSGTVPPSTYESGLINTPNPIDTTHNQVITGNVLGGKHFRGNVPYGSTTSFGAPLGSTTLDSFLRYSAVPNETGVRPSDYGSFYSPTGTVATTRPGQSGVFAPVSPRIAGILPQQRVEQPADVMAWAEVPQPQVSTGEANPIVDQRIGTWQQRQPSWPLSKTPEEIRRIISGELGEPSASQPVAPPRGELMTPEDYRQELEQFQRGLERLKAGASELEQSLTTDGLPSDVLAQSPREAVEPSGPGLPPQQPPSQPTLGLPDGNLLPRYRPPVPAVPPMLPERDTGRIPDVIPLPGQERTGIRPERLAAPDGELYQEPASPEKSPAGPPTPMDRIDAVFAVQGRPGAGSGSADTSGELPALTRFRETARAFDTPSRFLESPSKSVTGTEAATPDRLRSTSDRRNAAPNTVEGGQAQTQPDSAEMLAGDRILKKYEDAGPAAQERFDRYMRAAELYRQQGRYYRAAESFTLASMYKPADPRAYLGKGHVLLAAGEYVSSAVFLARAIEMDPRQALDRADLIEMVGGPDAFVQRIADLEQRAEAGDTPQLQFLLAYVYFQMERPAEAKTAMTAAENGLPPSVALDLLKAAVNR